MDLLRRPDWITFSPPLKHRFTWTRHGTLLDASDAANVVTEAAARAYVLVPHPVIGDLPKNAIAARTRLGSFYASAVRGDDSDSLRARDLAGELAQEDLMEEVLVAGQDYRVLSIRPQWAWAVMYGGKNIEYRTWATSYRGRMLIHASGKQVPASQLADVRREVAAMFRIPLSRVPEEFEASAILGSVELVDCVVQGPGNIEWVLRDVRPLAAPLRGVKGTLKVWHWTPEPAARGTKTKPPIAAPSDRPAAASQKAAVVSTEQGRPVTADNLDPSDVLAVFRSLANVAGTDERDFLREVSRKLGFSRMGARVEAELKTHLRTAVKRKLLTRDARVIRAATQTMADYDLDTLVQIVGSLIRRGRVMERQALSLALLDHLGFATPANSNGELAAPALDAAVKSSVLVPEGTKLRRAD